MLLIAKSNVGYRETNVTENFGITYCSFHVQRLFLKKALKVVKDPQQLMTVWVLLGCSLQKQSKYIKMLQKSNIN